MPEEVGENCSHLRRGWYWGTAGFAQKMLGMAASAVRGRKSRAYARSLEVRAHGTQQAELWLSEGLAAAGLSEADLPMLKSADPRKLALASLLWQHTTVSQGWLAEHLHLRSATNVSQLPRRVKAAGGERRDVLPKGLRQFLRKTPPI